MMACRNRWQAWLWRQPGVLFSFEQPEGSKRRLEGTGLSAYGWKFQGSRSSMRFFGMACRDRFECRFQVGEGLNAVDFGGFDQGCDAAPCLAAFVVTRK